MNVKKKRILIIINLFLVILSVFLLYKMILNHQLYLSQQSGIDGVFKIAFSDAVSNYPVSNGKFENEYLEKNSISLSICVIIFADLHRTGKIKLSEI